MYAYDHWLDVMRSINVWGKELQEPPSPLARADAIASMYFPNFDIPLAELRVAATSYEKWMIEAGQKRLDGKLAEVKDGFEEAFKLYRATFNALLEATRTFGRSEFGT